MSRLQVLLGHVLAGPLGRRAFSAAPLREQPLALLGLGGVGRELLEQVLAARAFHAERFGLRLGVAAVCDSTACVWAPEDPSVRQLLGAKQQGVALSQAAGALARPPAQAHADFLLEVAAALAEKDPRTVLVDCTASEATIPALLSGLPVVSANKKPFSGPMSAFEQLVLRPGVKTRYESTVMAGVPVIAAVQRLVAAQDQVSRVAGAFSGTLGFVASGLEQGRSFSAVVLEAKALGYTEPDPRDDLGGLDVARKALILARTLGLKLELADVSVEPLFPPELADLSVPQFLEALPTLDAGFAARAQAAAAEQQCLRYAASIDVKSGEVRVGLLAVPRQSPLGQLAGTDNLVEITSRWYASAPLVLRGAGAGFGTTAAGVLADLVDLA